MILLTTNDYVNLALDQTATTYGFNEVRCGDTHRPRKCSKGAITASGHLFDPTMPTAAVPMPKRRILKSMSLWVKTLSGNCVKLLINDKKNPRYIRKGGLDLSPAAQELLTGLPAVKHWSGKIVKCTMEDFLFKPKFINAYYFQISYISNT